MRKSILLVAVIVAGALVATPALAGKGGGDRPFKGVGSGQTIVAPTGPGTFDSASAGTITATHLGKGTYTVNATQDWTGATWFDNPCATVTAGTATFVAANGKKSVTGDVTGTTCELAPFNDTTYSSSLTVTITGGTGQFVGATGTLSINGVSTGPLPADGSFNDAFAVTGTISY